MAKFWNSYCVKPWDCWSTGPLMVRLCTPSQNTHESWHKQILQSKIPGMFKGSTEHVFAEALPQLIEMDAVCMPSTLQFDVPAIPKGMMQKALWYVEHVDTHIRAFEIDRPDMPDPVVCYYVLKEGQQ